MPLLWRENLASELDSSWKIYLLGSRNLPKDEGGLGVWNLHIIASAAPVKKVATIWGKHSILARWMLERYTKGQALQNISIISTIDYAQWKELMDSKDHINQCLDFRAGNSITWRIGNGKTNLGVIVEALWTKVTKDTIAKGIWLH